MILVDGHVHFYKCFNLGNFLENAFNNFNFQTERLLFAENNQKIFFLLFTEGDGYNYFSKLRNLAKRKTKIISEHNSIWEIKKTEDEITLAARRNDNPKETLNLVAGRQIVTYEKLEVLSLFTDRVVGDGSTLSQTTELVKQKGGIPIIPWGAGKWWGNRGRILEDFLKNNPPGSIFLGDNGGRPIFLPTPFHFKKARSRGFTIIPGSDPLPFPSQEKKPGSFGFSMEGDIDSSKPSDSLKELFLQQNPVIPFGQLESPFSFFVNQLKMQFHNKIIDKI